MPPKQGKGRQGKLNTSKGREGKAMAARPRKARQASPSKALEWFAKEGKAKPGKGTFWQGKAPEWFAMEGKQGKAKQSQGGQARPPSIVGSAGCTEHLKTNSFSSAKNVKGYLLASSDLEI